MQRTLVLIGLRVSGKTTLGKRVARDLDMPFVDLDDRVAEAFGVGHAADALRAHGLDRFREVEAECLKKALQENAIVLALGGGAPTAPGASDTLRGATDAFVVYLHARPETLAARLRHVGAASRPSLTGKDPTEEFEEMYTARHPLYADLASAVIESDVWDEDRLASNIAQAFTEAE